MLVEPSVAAGFTFALTPPVHAYVIEPVPPVITTPMVTGVPAQIVVAFKLGTIELGIWFTVNEGVTVNTLLQLAILAVRVYIPTSLLDRVAAVILALVIDEGLLMSTVCGPVQAYVGVPCPPVAVAVMVKAVPIHAGLEESTTGMLVGKYIGTARRRCRKCIYCLVTYSRSGDAR